ncbi:MAG: hypothetical protein G8345_19250 [Magnetococcales bacterium]|nr:hypothetical protein [Magnetococcales bacterium]NGZ29013.1 hypothetical protein [Magnetococcales bacterium]
MKSYPFDWTCQTFTPSESPLPAKDHLTFRATAVLLKHFLIPYGQHEIIHWRNDDHYHHHLAELEDRPGDVVRVKPWLIGEWQAEQPVVLCFDPPESSDLALSESIKEKISHLIHGDKKHGLLGLYLTMERKQDACLAVFAFRLGGNEQSRYLRDLPLIQGFCLATKGDEKSLIHWLDWAYRGVDIIT